MSNLVKRKGMPEFTSLRAADEWREVNAPARKTRQSAPTPHAVSSKNSVEGREKIAVSPVTTTPGPSRTSSAEQLAIPLAPPAAAPHGRTDGAEPPRERIDVTQFVRRDVDFVELQIANATELAQITYGLLKLKTADGEPGAIAAASKNWHETSKAAADVIEKFIALRREAGQLIPIDDVENVIATELEEIRKALKRLGRRVAPTANPDNPALAETAINAHVDKILAAFAALTDRARLELAALAEDEPSEIGAPVAPAPPPSAP